MSRTRTAMSACSALLEMTNDIGALFAACYEFGGPLHRPRKTKSICLKNMHEALTRTFGARYAANFPTSKALRRWILRHFCMASSKDPPHGQVYECHTHGVYRYQGFRPIV